MTSRRNLALTADLVAKREEMDDEVETPRSIDHMIRVSRSRADALVADLEAAGFDVRNRKSRLKVSVQFDRDDAVDQDTAAAFTREVMEIAERHGGEYDGWGALILPRGRKQYIPPEDAMPLADVDADLAWSGPPERSLPAPRRRPAAACARRGDEACRAVSVGGLGPVGPG